LVLNMNTFLVILAILGIVIWLNDTKPRTKKFGDGLLTDSDTRNFTPWDR